MSNNNRNVFKDSLKARGAVVLAQLESAFSKIATLPYNNEIKKSIIGLKWQVEYDRYPGNPSDLEIQQATQAITYANLINAMHSLPKDSVMLYSKSHLFLPSIEDKKWGCLKRCKPKDFEKMVQDVVDATEGSIIIDGIFYRKNDKPIELYENSMINDVGDITLIAEKLKTLSPDSELVIGINGAVHQMQPGGIEYWKPTMGENIVLMTVRKRLALEESMRKLLNNLRSKFLGTDVEITAELLGGEEKVQIGYAKYCDRQHEERWHNFFFKGDQLQIKKPVTETETGTGEEPATTSSINTEKTTPLEEETTSRYFIGSGGSVHQAIVADKEPVVVIEDGPGTSTNCSFCQNLLGIFSCCK